VKRNFVLTCFGAFALMLVCSAPVGAQDVVLNGDFETGDYSPQWTLTGGNAHTVLTYYQTVAGVTSLCVRRMPGKPNDNGSIEQQVLLYKGVTYNFTGDFAAVESG